MSSPASSPVWEQEEIQYSPLPMWGGDDTGKGAGSLKGWEGPSCGIRSSNLLRLLSGGSRRESLAWLHPRFRELLSLMMRSQVKFAFVYTRTHTHTQFSPLSPLKQKVAVCHPIPARQQLVNERSEFY